VLRLQENGISIRRLGSAGKRTAAFNGAAGISSD